MNIPSYIAAPLSVATFQDLLNLDPDEDYLQPNESLRIARDSGVFKLVSGENYPAFGTFIGNSTTVPGGQWVRVSPLNHVANGKPRIPPPFKGIIWRDISNPTAYQEWLSTGTESVNDWIPASNGYIQHYPGIFTYPVVDLEIIDGKVVWDASASNAYRLQLTDNVAEIELIDIPVGASITLFIEQNGVGHWDIPSTAWPQNLLWLGVAPPKIPAITSIPIILEFRSHDTLKLIGYQPQGPSADSVVEVGQASNVVTELGHNFTVGTALYLEDGHYRKAISNTVSSIGRYMVAQVINSNQFALATWMQMVPIEGLTPGAWYHTSPSVPGEIVEGVSYAPPEGGTVVNLMGQANEQGNALIFQNPIAWVAPKYHDDAKGEIVRSVGISPSVVSEPNHGFTVGTALYLNGSGYERAISNNPETIGRYMVSEVLNNNQVVLAAWMQIVPMDGLIPGTWYHVSPTTPGAIVAGLPDTPPPGGSIVNLIGQANHDGSGLIFQNPIAWV